jgi:putative lipoic acid-binding regulatory protein
VTERALLEFPCDFPLKAIGRDGDDFVPAVLSIIRRHVPALGSGAVVSRISDKGKYVAVTVTFTAESMEQIETIYSELRQEPRVLVLM